MANVWDDVPDWGGVGALRLERPEGVGSEEMIVVLHGTPTLRTPAGVSTLAEGDVVVFPRGPEGAKELRNESNAAVEHAGPDG